FKKLIQGLDKENNFEVYSAGVRAYPGAPASFLAVLEMQKIGIDISRHKARLVDADLVKNADFIFVMTNAHKKELLEMFPNIKDNIFLLKGYADENSDNLEIADPLGGGEEDYSNCAKEIKNSIEKILKRWKI
ncbi:MAG: low molecular weight protein arginine phosphatase, partial [Armatimonadetes bacterium]|nr:low molecular weight protein arginine phosphatase [Armatimonadota bacterium]